MKLGRSAGLWLWKVPEGPGISASVSSVSLSEVSACIAAEDVEAETAEVAA